MFSKVIIQGRLDFGNFNTYEKALKLYVQRKDTYYKNEVIFNKIEEVFDEERLIFYVKRFNNLVSDKTWRNTVHILKNLAEYSLSGRVEMWMMQDGKAIRHELIKPSTDKSIVFQFTKANNIVNENGDLQEAIKILDEVIAKYPSHAMAQALYGRIYARMNDYTKGLAYLDKAIELDPYLSEAFLWKAKLMIRQEKYADAVESLQRVTEFSNAQQNIHWIGRRLKGLCFYRLDQFKEAIFEWNLFAKRPFEKGNSNHYWQRAVTFNLGKAQLNLGQNADAVLSFNNALNLDSLFEYVTEDEIMEYKKLALGSKGGEKPKPSSKRSKTMNSKAKVSV